MILTEIPTGFLCLENRMMFPELLLNVLFSNWLLEKQASRFQKALESLKIRI